MWAFARATMPFSMGTGNEIQLSQHEIVTTFIRIDTRNLLCLDLQRKSLLLQLHVPKTGNCML